MVGVPTFRVSNAGRLLVLVQQPVILAGLASAIVVTLLLARPAGPASRTRRVRRRLAG